MSMPKQTSEELFSLSVCHAVAACAGINYSDAARDFGLDGSFCSLSKTEDGRVYQDGWQIDFQAKATSNFAFDDNNLIYDLEVKNYRDLINTRVGNTRILIVYLLPNQKDQWMTINENEIIFRHAAYWCSLFGCEDTTNKAKIRIRIPRNQKLTTAELLRLFDLIKRGERLHG